MAQTRVPWLQLNPAQSEAVRHIHGPLLILAGAGTGKTRVITTRIAHMLEEGIDPANILAVTFTNKAADEMRERVAHLVGKADAEKLTVSTFHSLCVRLLRRSIDLLGYKKNFTIYTQSDQTGLVRRIIARKAAKDEKLDPNVAISLISHAKNRDLPAADGEDTLIAEVRRTYQRELQTLNAVDFDDLLVLAARLLREFPVVRAHWRERYRFLMVDEFQDTNSLQMRLVNLLASEEKNVCVVGDDDQSIYGWRGAEVSNILEFERYFPNPKVVTLEENYRSARPILETANSVIRNNLGRRAKRLRASKPGEEKIRVIAMPGDREEADLIVHEIWDAHHLRQRPWEDFAILFRMNTQARVLEQTLRERNIPYRVVGAQSYYDRREVKDLLAYLSALRNPDDDISLLRVLNTPPRGIGDGLIALALEESVQKRCSVFRVLSDPDFRARVGSRGRGSLESFLRLRQEVAKELEARPHDYPTIFSKFLQDVEYSQYLTKTCRTEEERDGRAQAVHEFVKSMAEHRARRSGGVQDFLDRAALMAERDDKDDITAKRGVCLITLHAAKGLEFPNVYLVGLEEGILPHQRSVDEGGREEERRLLYVGITRAMEKLTLTYCHSRVRYGDPMPCRPSSFLRELGKEHVQHTTYEEWGKQPVTEEEAKQSFALLKDMLANLEPTK